MHLSPADGQSRIDLHMTNDTTGHNNNDGVQFVIKPGYIGKLENTNIYFATNNSTRLYIKNDELRNNTPLFKHYSNNTN
ncbi:MAG: hypothetical protein CM15mP42_05560 [Methanobacteriota archaeon]|nr:MAG: hypothetical protein CM15mP42_05560 [Euryarchaeota archaeon]